MRVKVESEKASLNLIIQKTNIIVSSLITSWQIDGGKVEIVQTLFLGLQKLSWTVTAAMKLKDVSSSEKKL